MIQDPESLSLIEDFFAAVQFRRLQQCRQLLTALDNRATNHPLFQQQLREWSTYLHGILVFEIEQDWAQAERIFTALLQQAPASLPRGRILYALGRALKIQGRWQEAAEVYGDALELADNSGDLLEQAKLWKQLATCYCEGYIQGDSDIDSLQKGLAYCKQALNALTEQPLSTSALRWLEGSIWNTQGAIYRYMEEWDEAITCYQRDLAICETLDDQHGIGVSYLNLGEVFHHRAQAAQPEWTEAHTYYREALARLRQYKNPHLEADALQNLGALHLAMGNEQNAHETYHAAVDLIEDLRTRISAAEARAGFFATVVNIYSKLVTLLIDAGDIAAAFDMVERARSRTFIEMLGSQPLRAPQAPTSLLQRETQLRMALRELYQDPDSDPAVIGTREAELDATLQEIRLFAAEYTDLRTVQPLTTEEVQQRLPPRTALLSYFMDDDTIYAFVVTHEAITVDPLPITPAVLQRAFDRDGNLLRLRPDSNHQLHEPWMLQRLYEFLVKPVVSRIQDAQQLCIIPHGQLHFVPFQALNYIDEAGKPVALIDNHYLLYAPSATVLLDYCQQDREPANGSLLAIGYNSDLQHAEAESRAIAALVEESMLLTNQDASSNALLEQAVAYRWIHIACHGSFHRQAPLMSHLRLADAPLYASDILQQLRLRADLVTLAACETGRNQVLKGDELLGLVRAFLYAGTSAVVVTLWPVDELSTRILMERFYGELLAGSSKAKALRTAQLYLRSLTTSKIIEILTRYGVEEPAEKVAILNRLTTPNEADVAAEQSPFAHPYFWAPFILVGDRLMATD